MYLLKCKPPGEKAALVSTCVNGSIKRPVFSFCVHSLPNLHPSFGSFISHMVSTQWMSWGPSDLLSLAVCTSEVWQTISMLQKWVGVKSSTQIIQRANQWGWAQAEPPAQLAMEDDDTFEHSQPAWLEGCYGEKAEHTFLVQSSLHIVPTSSPAHAFWGIYMWCHFVAEENCAGKKRTAPVLIFLGKSEAGKLLTDSQHNYPLYPHLKSALCQRSQYP